MVCLYFLVVIVKTLTICTLIYGFSTVAAQYWRNVAVGKLSLQSSSIVYDSKTCGPERANDGNRNTSFLSASCMETNPDFHPWWMVDLEKMYLISGVQLTNRDRNAHRMSNFSLEVAPYRNSSGHLIGSVLCHYHNGEQALNSTVFYPCSSRTVGRYMKLTQHRHERLCICEAEVIATEYEFHSQMRALRGKRSNNPVIKNVSTRGINRCQSYCVTTEGCTSFNSLTLEGNNFYCELLADPEPWVQDNDALGENWTHFVPDVYP